jgi:hypothetical protein
MKAKIKRFISELLADCLTADRSRQAATLLFGCGSAAFGV